MKMKKFLMFAMVLMALVFVTGCSTSKIYEIDPATGKVIKYTETETDIAGTIAQSLKDKSVFIWQTGWAGYVSVSPGTTEDPSPHGKFFIGKRDGGYFSLNKEHQNIDFDGLAKCIQATHSDLSISAGASGINASENSGSTSTETTAKTTTVTTGVKIIPDMPSTSRVIGNETGTPVEKIINPVK